MIDISVGLDAFGFHAVDDTEDPPSLLRLCNNHFNGVCGGAEDGAHFRYLLDRIENVDREAVLHEDDKAMSAGEIHGVLLCDIDEALVVADEADERGAGRFAERNAEFHGWVRRDNCFVEIFNGFDKVRLAEDKIHIGRLVDGDGCKFHSDAEKVERVL